MVSCGGVVSKKRAVSDILYVGIHPGSQRSGYRRNIRILGTWYIYTFFFFFFFFTSTYLVPGILVGKNDVFRGYDLVISCVSQST